MMQQQQQQPMAAALYLPTASFGTPSAAPWTAAQPFTSGQAVGSPVLGYPKQLGFPTAVGHNAVAPPSAAFPQKAPPLASSTPYAQPSSAPAKPVEEQTASESILFLDTTINERKVELLVDTGASVSVMSKTMMKSLRLERYLDSSKMGVASGVGRAIVLGELKNVPVQIGGMRLLVDFKVLSIKDKLAIFGMDQLQKNRCVIDIENRTLQFGGRNGVAVPFMAPAPDRFQPAKHLCSIM
mmetsp:Transcript_55358/g.132061  ORF Transcript_55358/g.132061 Transcript_55358/m.132061 type:complete len:240 (+) Transcript_55358:124-843(+)